MSGSSIPPLLTAAEDVFELAAGCELALGLELAADEVLPSEVALLDVALEDVALLEAALLEFALPEPDLLDAEPLTELLLSDSASDEEAPEDVSSESNLSMGSSYSDEVEPDGSALSLPLQAARARQHSSASETAKALRICNLS